MDVMESHIHSALIAGVCRLTPAYRAGWYRMEPEYATKKITRVAIAARSLH